MALPFPSRRSLILLLSPPLVAALISLLWQTDFARELENVTIDRRFIARSERDPAPHPEIALVGIGEQSLEKVGRWQDWTRDIHAQFLTALTYRPPKIIAFDLFFPEASKNESQDLAFADALASMHGSMTGMYVQPEEAGTERSIPTDPDLLATLSALPNFEGDINAVLGGSSADLPIPVIAESSYTGSVNFPPSEIDGLRREIPLIVRLNDQIYPSLVLQMLMQKADAKPEDVHIYLGREIRVPKAGGGSWSIPIDQRGLHYLNYRSTARFLITDYIALFLQINKTASGAPWPDELPPIEDQIVIVGQSAQGLSDFGPTPYRALDPLFVVQATALDSILREDFITRTSPGLTLGAWLILAWGTMFLLQRAPTLLAILIPAVIVVSFVGIAFAVFTSHSILFPMVLPIAGFVAVHSIMIGDRLAVESKEKKYIRGVFGSYVAPDIVNQIISSGKTPELGGEKVNITVLFSDIQGFSTFSEQLTPEALVELMVEYLSALTDIVTDSGGTLDKYIGDAIDAMFGAPLPLEGHAYKGVMAAIKMQRKQIELDEFWQEENRPEIIQQMRTRIGLNTGAAVVGNMGSKRRFNYTMMGDNVNLGARCESAAKTYGVYTMITEDTYRAAREVKDDIVYRYLDQIIVQGRTLPVKIYEVFEQANRVSEDSIRCIEIYEEAYRAYLACEWDKAISLFEQSSALEFYQPGRDHGIKTNPSLVMIARCEVMKGTPPEENWDGVYRMTTK
ncbi:MAG: adenylate/guanylate cyclase domain-containing protein [Verrucomicrobiales bacterium]|nr:adenylate/guanylate cyclase domain-containing protein [Verrucomicrobiales bacterium]